MKKSEMRLEDLACIRHQEMKPLNINETADTRSQKRIDFCKAVVQEAKEIVMKLGNDLAWRKLFNDERNSAVRVDMEGSEHIGELLNVVKSLHPVTMSERPR